MIDEAQPASKSVVRRGWKQGLPVRTPVRELVPGPRVRGLAAGQTYAILAAIPPKGKQRRN